MLGYFAVRFVASTPSSIAAIPLSIRPTLLPFPPFSSLRPTISSSSYSTTLSLGAILAWPAAGIRTFPEHSFFWSMLCQVRGLYGSWVFFMWLVGSLVRGLELDVMIWGGGTVLGLMDWGFGSWCVLLVVGLLEVGSVWIWISLTRARTVLAGMGLLCFR